MTEFDHEPIPGLPKELPDGEEILWQGSPNWRALARTAFHTHLVAGYFALLTAWAIVSALIDGSPSSAAFAGALSTLLVGAVGVALLHLLAWASARSSIYTLTNRRLVLRIGIALPTCINLPLKLVGEVNLALHSDGTGDIPVTVNGEQRLGYLALWPHARPWKLSRPQPTLRAVPDADAVAALIARHCQALNAQTASLEVPTLAEAAAA